MSIKPTNARRKLWLTFVVFTTIGGLSSATGMAYVAGLFVGGFIMYALPIVLYELVMNITGSGKEVTTSPP